MISLSENETALRVRDARLAIRNCVIDYFALHSEMFSHTTQSFSLTPLDRAMNRMKFTTKLRFTDTRARLVEQVQNDRRSTEMKGHLWNVDRKKRLRQRAAQWTATCATFATKWTVRTQLSIMHTTHADDTLQRRKTD